MRIQSVQHLIQQGESSEVLWRQVREVCSRTGNDGQEIGSDRWKFFGEYWIGPYQALVPEWTWVVRGDGLENGVVGYLTGCPNSGLFYQQKAERFLPALWSKVFTGHFHRTSDIPRALRRENGFDPQPTDLFPSELRLQVERDFPGHLHMNLLPKARGQGWGERLHGVFCQALQEVGVQGVHLYCGKGPLQHYIRNGFEVVSIQEWGTNRVPIHLLTKSLRKSGAQLSPFPTAKAIQEAPRP